MKDILIKKSWAMKIISSAVSEAKSEFLKMPKQLADTLAMETNPKKIEKLISKETRKTLLRLSKTKI